MLKLLNEYSPRKSTPTYLMHRLRAVVEHQLNWLFPLLAFLAFCSIAAVAIAEYLEGTTVQRLATSLPCCLFAGVLAALGTKAYYGPINTRIQLLLAAHPQSQSSITAGYRLPSKPVFDVPGLVLGEMHVTRNYDAAGNYKLSYQIDEVYSPTPEFSILGAQSLVTGLIVFGSVGSGKTSYVLRPAVFKLFHHDSRPGGLVMDSKAALVDPLKEEMINANRSADLLAVGPEQATKWNPLHDPLASPATIADSLLTTLENVNGKPFGAEIRWIRSGAAHLAEAAIGLLRLRSGYVTSSAIRILLSDCQMLVVGSDTPGKEIEDYITALFTGSPPMTPKRLKEYEFYLRLLKDRMSEDAKFRTIYASELMNLLIPLTSPDVEHLYNAAEDELDMPAWVDCINRGLVIVLDCNRRKHPHLAVILGMLLKLSYENTMLARLDLVRKGECNEDRYMCLVIDEYQDFASPDDASYQALARESKSITVLLTQGQASIVERIGEDRAKVLLQSLRNRLILHQTAPEFAADSLGQQNTEAVDQNISENVVGATLKASGQFGGESTVSQSYSVRQKREHIVPPEMLANLPLGQGILQSHDGKRTIPLHRVFLLPFFAEPGVRHADL